MKSFFLRFLPFSHNEHVRQFYKFSVIGVSNTIIDFSLYYVLTRTIFTFSFGYLFANVISFSVAVTNSYVWNRMWTFRSTNSNKILEYTKFYFVNLSGLLLSTGLLFIFVHFVHLHDTVGKLLAIILVLFWNFLINKVWVFKV